jgi:hypothetical protein
LHIIGRIRMLAVVGAASALLLPLSAQAGTSGARFSDPAGDIAVPSLDLVSGLVRLDSSGKSRLLTMTATMAADLTGVPGDYDLVTGTRRGGSCYTLAARVRWNGVSLAQSYQRVSTFACESTPTPAVLVSLAGQAAQYAAGGDPVDATAGGRTVAVTLAAPAWLSPGSLASFAVLSHTTAVGFSTFAGATEVSTYDIGGVDRQWLVG